MILDELAATIQQATKQIYGIDLPEVAVDYAQAGFGDFSSNVAFQLAKQVGKPPREIAQSIADVITHKSVDRVEPAGAGFLNLYITNKYWQEQLKGISLDYARHDIGQHQKVQVEYISANPTGPLTIGNARGGFIGDVLSNVLEWSGYDVTREYYFNDAGSQITKLLESVKMQAGLLPETEERQYRGEYTALLAEKYKSELLVKNDDELKALITGEIIKVYIKPAIEAMGVRYDLWFNEKELLRNGLFDETVKRLDALGLVFKKDGAVWLRTGDLGDERGERVIIKSNGDPTYMAPDIAYHVNIFGERGFDYAIKVLGPDHVAQFPSVHAAVKALFPEKRMRMAGYQQLRIVKDGNEVKVSKRLGQFITAQELIDQVTAPVARFFTLMRSADSHMDFDLGLAAEQSAKNPYYYVMYSYARAHSILAKAKERDIDPAVEPGELSPAEVAMVRAMTRLPGMISEMAEDYGVHRLTFYGLEMAKLFTEFYESVRIINLPPEEAGQKLYVVAQFVTFMDVYWRLLGIQPETRMERDATV